MSKKTECSCHCHLGAKISHWQFMASGEYEESKCACTIPGNPNFVPEEIRKTWE